MNSHTLLIKTNGHIRERLGRHESLDSRRVDLTLIRVLGRKAFDSCVTIAIVKITAPVVANTGKSTRAITSRPRKLGPFHETNSYGGRMDARCKRRFFHYINIRRSDGYKTVGTVPCPGVWHRHFSDAYTPTTCRPDNHRSGSARNPIRRRRLPPP